MSGRREKMQGVGKKRRKKKYYSLRTELPGTLVGA